MGGAAPTPRRRERRMTAIARFPIERRLPAEAAHLADAVAQIIARAGSDGDQVQLLGMARAFTDQSPEDRELLRRAREKIAKLPKRPGR